VGDGGRDELIHAPTRLAIVSLLAAAQWADFKYIRDELGLSDSALRPPGIRTACGGPPANHCQVTAQWPRRSGR
jgi:hypothetical protein